MSGGETSVICLHGLGRSPADWAGVRGALARYGAVCAPALTAGPLESVVASIAQPPGRAILIGHSMSGVVALRRAAAAPGDVRALILTDSFFPPARNGRTLAATARDYGSHRLSLLRELAARGIRPRPRRTTARGLGSLARLGVRPQAFHAVADAVSAPVLVVHARRDHHVPVDFAIAAAARHRSWTLRILEPGGHNVHAEHPDDWLAAVAPWLDAL